eukprot:1138382-Pelagomonas_calceolata.AAC.15
MRAPCVGCRAVSGASEPRGGAVAAACGSGLAAVPSTRGLGAAAAAGGSARTPSGSGGGGDAIMAAAHPAELHGG